MTTESPVGDLARRLRARSLERELERLRPLGEAFVARRFGATLNRADAEDAVSEVLIRLHRRIEAGQPPHNLRAAFFTSVRNAAIDMLRTRAAKPTVALEAALNAHSDRALPAERAEDREDAVRLQQALRRMRGNYRQTIILRFGYGLTVPEIAEHLGVSLPAAKKLVLRATRQVKARYATIEGEEAYSFATALVLIAASAFARLRTAAFRIAALLHPAETDAAGPLAGTGQKIVAACGIAATSATCLVSGIVGPHLAATSAPRPPAPGPLHEVVKTVAQPLAREPSLRHRARHPQPRPPAPSHMNAVPNSPFVAKGTLPPPPPSTPEFGIERAAPPPPASPPPSAGDPKSPPEFGF